MNVEEKVETLDQILPLWARSNPEREAIVWLDGSGSRTALSFAEYDRRAARCAALFAARGAEPDDRIAIVMPNCPEWVLAYFGVFRLGAVAVPLEHGMLAEEPERIDYALQHSGARLVVCRAADAGLVRELAPPETPVLPIGEAEGFEGSPPPTPQPEPDDLAQILYTSGTTGPRKGVALSHRNLIFNVRKSCARFGVGDDDVVPALLPYHHAYPLTATVLLPAFAGARMAVGDIRGRRSRELLRRCRPTVLIGVPRVFESLLGGIEKAAEREGRRADLERARRVCRLVKSWTGLNPGKLIFRRLHVQLFGGTQLRFCVSGGARISPRILRGLFRLGIPVVQGWGMSELSPVGAVQAFTPWRFWLTHHYEREAGSIGTPLDGTRIVLRPPPTEALSLDTGARGEMIAGGPHVMLGYYRDPERTRRQMAAEGLRTGDIARRDRHGHLRIVGRIKHVIVLASGKKVFPEDELEEDLRQCPTIEQFAVRPIGGADEGEMIGIIVRPDVDELRERPVETLADLYAAVKADIDASLKGKPHYLRQYDFCLSEWDEAAGEYAKLISTAMGDPSPLRNPFRQGTAYSRLRGSDEPVPW